jgi:hypothetical protein
MKKLAGLLAMPLLVACASASGSPGASERAFPSLEIPIPSQAAEPSGGADGLPTGMIEDVLALAEAETGVDPSEIEVVVAEAVTWSDGSIGCPEEGMAYTQALVPGYRVVLNIAGEELAFHAAENGEFSPCRTPVAPLDGSADS